MLAQILTITVTLIGGLPGGLTAGPVQAAEAQTQNQSQTSDMEKVLTRYVAIQQSLAEDRLSGVQEDAALLIPATRGLKDEKLSESIQKEARNLMQAAGGSGGHGSLSQARDSFKKLSAPIVDWVKKNKPSGWSVIHCPMAGASWIQKEGSEIQNPYHGQEMASCGMKVS